jgi:hypothetical protein
MNAIDKIRAALEGSRDMLPEYFATRRQCEDALAELETEMATLRERAEAELTRLLAQEPVGDVGNGFVTWRDGKRPAYLTKLYAEPMPAQEAK